MRTFRPAIVVFLFAVFAGSAISACGGGDDDASSSKKETSESTFEGASDPTDSTEESDDSDTTRAGGSSTKCKGSAKGIASAAEQVDELGESFGVEMTSKERCCLVENVLDNFSEEDLDSDRDPTPAELQELGSIFDDCLKSDRVVELAVANFGFDLTAKQTSCLKQELKGKLTWTSLMEIGASDEAPAGNSPIVKDVTRAALDCDIDLTASSTDDTTETT